MKLVYKGTNKEVQPHDVLTSSKGERYYAEYWREPDHGSGKITVLKDLNDHCSAREYYVGVFGLEWKEEPNELRKWLHNRIHESVPLLEWLSDEELLNMNSYEELVEKAHQHIDEMPDDELDKLYKEWY